MTRRSISGLRSAGRFYHFCLEVTRGKHPTVSKFGRGFCRDFVTPPLDRSPQSFGALMAILDGHGACQAAVEGAEDVWSHFERWRSA